MNTAAQPVLMGSDHLDITVYSDPTELLARLREANDYRADTPDDGFVWEFRLGPSDDDPALLLGIRGEIGALVWYGKQDKFVPAGGLNTDYANYWTWFGHEAPMRPGSEVPIEQVYAALDELIRTHQRPACIDWVAA